MTPFEREVITKLVAVCDEIDDFSILHPEDYAALYWVKAILDPVRYAKDHPVVAELLGKNKPEPQPAEEK